MNNNNSKDSVYLSIPQSTNTLVVERDNLDNKSINFSHLMGKLPANLFSGYLPFFQK